MDELSPGIPPGSGGSLTLHPECRRVLGVLLEKCLATPEYYPMTLKAVVAGCNQKSNRHPVVQYGDEDVLDALAELRSLKLVIAVKDSGSRATRWKQELQRVYNLQGKELAVLAELLLRGPQSEGELRARASRMRPLEDLDTLHETLAVLRERTPTFAVRLSPEGAVRGVRHAHALYFEEELERLRTEVVEQGSAAEAPVAAGALRTSSEVAELRERVESLESRLTRLEESLGVEGSN